MESAISECIVYRKATRRHFIITSLTNRWLKKTFLLESFEVCNEKRERKREELEANGAYIYNEAGADRFLYSATMFNFDIPSWNEGSQLVKKLEAAK